MTQWREKALELLPGLRETIVSAENPMALWIDLHMTLERAYETNPPDEHVIENIFKYAHWSGFESGDDDAQTAVSVAFYEHLPAHAKVRTDLSNRITKEEFSQLRGLFQYFLEPSEYQAFEREFLAAVERKTN
jgi:hypothetical protein